MNCTKVIDTISIDVVTETRADAQRRLDDALAPLSDDDRQRAESAIREIAWVDELIMRARSRSRTPLPRRSVNDFTVEGSTTGSTQATSIAQLKRPPYSEAAYWSTVASMIGTTSVSAADIKTMAAEAGMNLSSAQAARKLQNWVQAKCMIRTDRGVFAFTKKGLQRYGIITDD